MVHNKVTLAGYFARDPELRHTPSGSTVCNASVAYNPPSYTDRKSGRRIEPDAIFVEIFRWGKAAETMARNFSKGQPVFLTGELVSDSWKDEKRNVQRTKLKVSVQMMQRVRTRGFNYCRIEICGNLTRDPKACNYRVGTEDKTLAAFSIAYNGFEFEDSNTHQKRKPEPVYVETACYDVDATNMLKFKRSGDTLFLEGTLENHVWTPKGSQDEVTDVRFKVLQHGIHYITRESQKPESDGADSSAQDRFSAPPRTERQPALAGARSAPGSVENLDEDVPF